MITFYFTKLSSESYYGKVKFPRFVMVLNYLVQFMYFVFFSPKKTKKNKTLKYKNTKKMERCSHVLCLCISIVI